jgi:cytochrome b561
MPAPASTQHCPTVQPYSRAAMTLHWLLAIAMLAELALGWWMVDVPKGPPGVRAGWFNLHKSIGLVIGLVVVLRVLWRAAHPPPQDPLRPAWQRRAAHCAHALLYAGMLGFALSGYLGSTFTRYPVRFFGVVLPDWNRDWPVGKELMSTLHNGLAWLFVALLALHIGAALWHWLQRDGIVDRMGVPSVSRN